MRQRGYEIQILVLNSTVAAPPAELLFPHLPTPNTTAFKFVLNVRTFGYPGSFCPLRFWPGVSVRLPVACSPTCTCSYLVCQDQHGFVVRPSQQEPFDC